jgi:hypothetical protein
MRFYPTNPSARVPFPLATSLDTCPISGGDAPFSDYLLNLFRAGQLAFEDPNAANTPHLTDCESSSLAGPPVALNQMLSVQLNIHTPAAKALESQSLSDDFVLFVIPAQDFCTYAPDVATLSAQPGYSDSTWANASFVNVVARESAAITAWLTAYVAAGGKTPAHVAVDQENGPGWYYVEPRGGLNNAKAIYNTSPYFQLRFGYATYDLWIASLTFPSDAYWFLAWDDAVFACFNAGLDDAYTTPIQSVWPDVQVSFYASQHITKAQSALVPYLTGFGDFFTTKPGTHTAPEMYGWTNNGAAWGTRNFDVCLWEIARLRAQRVSFPETPITPWVAYPQYIAPSSTTTGYSHTREKLFHCFLAGCERVLYFNPHPPFGGTAEADAYMDAAAEEIDSRFSDRLLTPLSNTTPLTSSSKNAQWFMSGARVGGQYIWRVTVSEKVLGVTVNGTAYSLDPDVYGIWAITATSATPTVSVTLESGPL